MLPKCSVSYRVEGDAVRSHAFPCCTARLQYRKQAVWRKDIMHVKERAGCSPYHSPEMGGVTTSTDMLKSKALRPLLRSTEKLGKHLSATSTDEAVVWPTLIPMSCWCENPDE